MNNPRIPLILTIIITLSILFSSCSISKANVRKDKSYAEGYITNIEKQNNYNYEISITGVNNLTVLNTKKEIVEKNDLKVGDYVRVTDFINTNDNYTITKLDYRKIEGNIIKKEKTGKNELLCIKTTKEEIKLEVNEETIKYSKFFKIGDYISAEGRYEDNKIICYRLIRH